MKLLLLVFLAVPLVEIYLLIKVGSAVGVGMTLFLVVFTAFLGAVLVRAQGFSTLSRARGQLNRGETPAMEMLEGLALFIAGALLLTPGFFTDAVGFMLLTPPLRRVMIYRLISRATVRPDVPGGPGGSAYEPATRRPRVIDVDPGDVD